VADAFSCYTDLSDKKEIPRKTGIIELEQQDRKNRARIMEQKSRAKKNRAKKMEQK
jgi:hypothetical protein